MTTETIKLPLQESVAEHLLANGLTYGSTYPAADIAALFRCDNIDSVEFKFCVASLRKELICKGFFLSGKGHHGKAFSVVPAFANCEVAESMAAQARRKLSAGYILGTTTDTTGLTDPQKLRHSAIVERMGHRVALLARAEQGELK